MCDGYHDGEKSNRKNGKLLIIFFFLFSKKGRAFVNINNRNRFRGTQFITRSNDVVLYEL